MAINKCAERLRGLYRRLGDANPTTRSARFMWPNPTADPPQPTKGAQELEFFCKVDRLLGTPINQAAIDEENKRHAMYLARPPTGVEGGTLTEDKVLVKFAVKYNEDAHRLLADHDPPLAPTLHSCTRVIGDMFMVVMQYIPSSGGASLYACSLSPAVFEAVHRDISEALKLLHEQDLVFGDLRETNVLYLQNEGRAMLTDFDAVGRHGKDRYSACLNPDANLGVDRLQIMEKLHDEENLRRLMDRLSKGLSASRSV